MVRDYKAEVEAVKFGVEDRNTEIEEGRLAQQPRCDSYGDAARERDETIQGLEKVVQVVQSTIETIVPADTFVIKDDTTANVSTVCGADSVAAGSSSRGRKGTTPRIPGWRTSGNVGISSRAAAPTRDVSQTNVENTELSGIERAILEKVTLTRTRSRPKQRRSRGSTRLRAIQ